MTKINFEIPYLEFSENFVIENNGKSTVIFGSNGMGKTSIYNAIKKQHDEFDYVDYTNMKNAFLNGKAKEINVTPHIQEYNNLLIERINIGDSLDITDSLKRFDINSGPKVRMVAPMLNEVQRTKQVDSKITISESNHARLSGTSDSDIRFLSQYFDGLKEISDIEDDIKSLKEEYLKDVLKHLDDNINESTKICPVCSSEVPDLKLIIQRKIKSAKLIKNEFLIKFKEINNSTKNEQIIERFNHLLTLAKDFTLQDITDYILVPNFEKIAMINKGVKQILMSI